MVKLVRSITYRVDIMLRLLDQSSLELICIIFWVYLRNVAYPQKVSSAHCTRQVSTLMEVQVSFGITGFMAEEFTVLQFGLR